MWDFAFGCLEVSLSMSKRQNSKKFLSFRAMIGVAVTQAYATVVRVGNPHSSEEGGGSWGGHPQVSAVEAEKHVRTSPVASS